MPEGFKVIFSSQKQPKLQNLSELETIETERNGYILNFKTILNYSSVTWCLLIHQNHFIPRLILKFTKNKQFA